MTGTASGGASAFFVKTDAITQGNWQGVYGHDGYSIANSSQSLPTYSTFATQGQLNYTWAANPADVRALQTGTGSTRIASTWYSNTSFSMNLNLTDGKAHQIALYAVDWDSYLGGRSEKIQLVDANNPSSILDTENISAFQSGVYLVWIVSGDIKINVTSTGPSNAVISAVFFGAGNAAATPMVTWTQPAPIGYGTPLSVQQLNATANVPGNFIYVPAAGAVLAAGNQSLATTFVPTDTSDYNAATASVTIAVNQVTPTVTWAAPADITYGTPLSSTQLNANASVPGSFSYTPSSGTVLPVGTPSLSVMFTPTDSTDYKSVTASVT